MAKSTGSILTDLAGDLLGSGKLDLDSILGTAGDLIGSKVGGKKSFPALSVANWKKLVTRFRSNVPANITKRWLADALGVSASTVESSIQPALLDLGLVTKDEKSTKLAEALGSDSTYKNALAKILKAEYPEELLEMDFETRTAQSKVLAYIKKASGESDTKAKTMANLYLHLRTEFESETSSVSAKTTKQTTETTTRKTTGGYSVSVKLEFPTKTSADTFVALLKQFTEQVSDKVAKL